MKHLYIVALALVLAGCGGDPPPAAPPAPTHSVSSPAAAAPMMPEEAKEDSEEGAAAFVRHYADLINFAQATGDTQSLSAASGAACSACKRTIRSIRRLYANGGRLEGGAWKIGESVGARDEATDDWLITTRASYAEQKAITPGQPTNTFTGGSARYDFLISPPPGRKVVKWSRAF